MQQTNNHYAQLADRARNGDEQARRQFLRELEPSLKRIVHRAMQTGTPTTPLLQQVQTVIARLTGGAPAAVDEASLAHDLSRLIATRTWCGPTQVCAPTIA